MDLGVISNMVMNMGFPIVACAAMAWYVKDTNDKHRAEVQQLNEQHRVEMEQVTTALNNNTLALQQLCDKLGEERVA